MHISSKHQFRIYSLTLFFHIIFSLRIQERRVKSGDVVSGIFSHSIFIVKPIIESERISFEDERCKLKTLIYQTVHRLGDRQMLKKAEKL